MKKFENKQTGVLSTSDLNSLKGKIIYWSFFVCLVIVTVMSVVPAIWTFLTAFKDTKEIYAAFSFFPQDMSLHKAVSRISESWNYLRLGSSFINTVVLSIGSLVFSIIVCGFGGYVLSKLKPVLYKQMGVLGYKNHGNTAYKKKGKRKFSYPELKFIELLHNNVFKITKMEVEYKYGVTDSGNDKNKAIKEAYEFYNSELDKVDLLSKDKDKTMEYICSCIVFHSYERLQRVKLCADIAKYLVENNLKPEDIRSSKQYKNLMAMFWVDQFDSKCGMLERAYDIHNYKEKLSLIFDNDLSDQAVKFIILRCSFKRTIAGKIYNIMDCYFKKHHKKLKNEDFEYAAEMFRKTYTPYEKIDLITEDGKDDSDYEEQQKKVRMYYDYIREIFSYRKDMDYQMLNIARNELCNK